MEYGVDILVRNIAARGVVLVFLGCDLEIVGPEDVFKLLCLPIYLSVQSSSSIEGIIILFKRRMLKHGYLMPVCPENVVFAPREVRMHLPW